MNYENQYPLYHKNFEGATLPVVPVRIIDIIDDYFVIEFQSTKTTTVKQKDFIEFHKSLKSTEKNVPSFTFSNKNEENSPSNKQEINSNEKIDIMWDWYEKNVLNNTNSPFSDEDIPF